MGSKFYLVTNQQTLEKGELEDSSIQALFHILFDGRPMLEYETMYDMFASLKVRNNLSTHLFNSTN